MKTPCCKKIIREDEIWELIENDDFGTTNKSFECPYCHKTLTCYLNIESIEVDD